MFHQDASELLLEEDQYVLLNDGRGLADAVRRPFSLAGQERGPPRPSPPSPLPKASTPLRPGSRAWGSWWPWSRPANGPQGEGAMPRGAWRDEAHGEGDGAGVLVTPDGARGGGGEATEGGRGRRRGDVHPDLGGPGMAGIRGFEMSGMRAPPFLLPRAYAGDQEVQVRSVGRTVRALARLSLSVRWRRSPVGRSERDAGRALSV